MKFKDEKYILCFDENELYLLIECVNCARSHYLSEGKPIEDVDELLIRIIKAPKRKIKVRS